MRFENKIENNFQKYIIDNLLPQTKMSSITNIKMSLCEKANHLKPLGRTAYIDAERFKYLYGDYYSTDFMRNIDDECYFQIKYYYEDREERKGADSVWCDMYWKIDDADMPNAEQFEDECNRIKYYVYNGSSGIAMTMCGLDFVDEEDEDEDELN